MINPLCNFCFMVKESHGFTFTYENRIKSVCVGDTPTWYDGSMGMKVLAKLIRQLSLSSRICSRFWSKKKRIMYSINSFKAKEISFNEKLYFRSLNYHKF